MRWIALTFAALVFAAPAFAEGTNTHDCTMVQIDPSLVSHYALPEGVACSAQAVTPNYKSVDMLLGISWRYAPNGASTSVLVIEPSPVSVAESMKLCWFRGPEDEFLDFWFVPQLTSCNNRGGDFVVRYRRFEFDTRQVVNLPTANTVPFDKLTRPGQIRLSWIIRRATGKEFPPSFRDVN